MKHINSYLLTSDEVSNALAQYLTDHKSLNIKEGCLSYEIMEDGELLVKVYEFSENMELH